MRVSLIEVVGIYAVIGILIPGSPLLDMADSGINLTQRVESSFWYWMAAVPMAHAVGYAVIRYLKRHQLKARI